MEMLFNCAILGFEISQLALDQDTETPIRFPNKVLRPMTCFLCLKPLTRYRFFPAKFLNSETLFSFANPI